MGAMSDEQQVPPEEEEKDEQPVAEDASAPKRKRKPTARKVKDDDEVDDTALSAEELRAELQEVGSRAREAGLNPLRRMVRSYVDNMLDAVDGLLGALEGNKRKRGD